MVVLSLVVALVAIVVAVLALRRVHVVDRRVSKRLAADGDLAAVEPSGHHTPADVTAAGTTATGATGTGAIAAPGPDLAGGADLVARIAALESRTFDGISRVAVVRYDAFEGSGGLLSYSVALVDEQGHGLVLTAIHGQSETRTYVKEIPLTQDTERPAELSPEEREALGKASGSRASGSGANASKANGKTDKKRMARNKLDRKSGR